MGTIGCWIAAAAEDGRPVPASADPRGLAGKALADLVHGAAEWQQGVNGGDENQCRSAWLLQLRGVRELTRLLGIEPAVIHPLAILMDALLSASRGKAHPLLKPYRFSDQDGHRRSGEGPGPLLPMLARARAAAALYRLTESGKAPEAAAAVVKHIKN